MNLADGVLVLLALLAGFAGLRQGFVVAWLGLVGFVLGGLLGLIVAARVAGELDGMTRTLAAVGVAVLAAVLGQALAAHLGGRLRATFTARPVRWLDAAAGAALSVVGALVAGWLVLGAASGLGGVFAGEAEQSRVLATLDRTLPVGPDQVVAALGTVVDATGFGTAVGGLTTGGAVPVPEPDPSLAGTPAVQQAALGVVKVRGPAPACGRRVEGSGFVVGPGRVLTNAHVVAGVDRPRVYVGGGGIGLSARVVRFDAADDVAVLDVPGLPDALPVLRFGTARRGDPVVVLGYPGDGPLEVSPGRVRGPVRAYGPAPGALGASTSRTVLSLRVSVRPGNSGGPALAADGSVVGVVYAASTTDTQTGFALPPALVADDVQAGLAATASVGTGACRQSD